MDHSAPNSANSAHIWFYECVGPDHTIVITPSETEAFFWHRLGYVVRHATYRSY